MAVAGPPSYEPEVVPALEPEAGRVLRARSGSGARTRGGPRPTSQKWFRRSNPRRAASYEPEVIPAAQPEADPVWDRCAGFTAHSAIRIESATTSPPSVTSTGTARCLLSRSTSRRPSVIQGRKRGRCEAVNPDHLWLVAGQAQRLVGVMAGVSARAGRLDRRRADVEPHARTVLRDESGRCWGRPVLIDGVRCPIAPLTRQCCGSGCVGTVVLRAPPLGLASGEGREDALVASISWSSMARRCF
jgi:hypothetical protein